MNAIAIPYLLQVSITLSSRIEPPGCAMYSTPLLCALSMLSPKGKNADVYKRQRVMYIVDGNIRDEYNLGRCESNSQVRERERALNNRLLELGW